MNTDSQINIERVRQELRSRFNPLRGLTPQTLATQLDDFRRGYFSRVAQTFDIIERRDDTLATVSRKRKRGVGRHGWEILTLDNSPAAERQKEVLEYFWNNIRVSHALKRNLRGGWGTLCEQMLDAVGKEYAAHELIWSADRSNRSRPTLRCEFQFVPLWFFEATEGELRYLPSPGASTGIELEQDAWMVTVGDGIMEAAAVNYMFKRLPMQDWLGYSEKYGFPWPHLETTASFGSKEWNAAVDALSGFLNDGSLVTSTGQKLTLHEVQGKGPEIFKDLIERMDRAMVMLWRGADLSTMSAGDSVGASVQSEETDLLEQDDALLIEDTLNAQVCDFVLRYHFGERVEPLAYLKVRTGARTDDAADLKKWELGANHGVALSAVAYRERFGLPAPEEGEEILQPASGPAAVPLASEIANARSQADRESDEREFEEFEGRALDRAQSATVAAHRPVLDRLGEIAETANADEQRRMLEDLRDALPQYLRADGPLARAYEDAYGTALIEGAAEAQQETE
jgi:phage gp29-like protein